MKLYHEWAAAAASGRSAHVLAIDIAGVFDKVSHAGPLHKVAVYGLDGALHGWLSSYLIGRSIHAVVGGQSSSSSEITSGVPQGSILGPTLLLLSCIKTTVKMCYRTALASVHMRTTQQCTSAYLQMTAYFAQRRSFKRPLMMLLSGVTPGESGLNHQCTRPLPSTSTDLLETCLPSSLTACQ